MKGITKAEYFISKRVGMAINRYKMISAGDRVLVGVSGGKDSLTLLRILQERKRWLPIDYKIKAIHISTDQDQQPEVKRDRLKEYFEELGCDHVFRDVSIAEKNKLGRLDCFWCSWNRRKAIFEAAAETGFNKVALGHHKDDIVETILMNMIFNGEISGINPVQSLFGGKIAIIRPLIFLEEKDIRRYVKGAKLPVIRSSCPRSRNSKRALIKDMVARLSKVNQDIKSNILRAPHRIKTEYLGEVPEEGIPGGDEGQRITDAGQGPVAGGRS
ncbi:MAG: ATP-binding protein [Candidatus Omnitrophota bacterium]|nr:ATP-binding protein [Candidatus Omnitrophota bacterium]